MIRDRMVMFLIMMLLNVVVANARIGGTTSEFGRSDFAKALGLVLKSTSAKADVYYGKGDVLIAIFKGSDGHIIRQRLKWVGNNYPEVKAMLLVYIVFCMEATATKEQDAARQVLIDRLVTAARGSGRFDFKQYKIFMGEFDDSAQGIEGHLMIEVSK